MSLYHNPNMVTNGLVLCLDAGNTKSYPGYGTTFTDLCGLGNHGTLTNGPTFNDYDSRTNGNLYSNDVTNAYYTQSFVTVGASSETAPNGTLTASYFTLSSTVALYKGVTGGYITYPTSSIVTISCFVKPTGGARYFWIREGGYGASRVGFDLTSVSVFSSSYATGYINAAGNGWYRVQAIMGALPQSSARVQLLGASDTTPPGNSYVSSAGTETYHIWGAQCELGSFATSPMLTTSSTVTRAAGPATLVFDGINDYVTMPSTGNVLSFGTNDFAVNFWIYMSSTANQTIFTNYTSYNTGFVNYFFIGYLSGLSGIYILDSSGNTTSPTQVGASITQNTWTHIIFTRTGTTYYCYKNGVLVNSQSDTDVNYSGTGRTILLGGGLADFGYMNGRIANTTVYNKVLSQAEVLQNFNPYRGRFGI